MGTAVLPQIQKALIQEDKHSRPYRDSRFINNVPIVCTSGATLWAKDRAVPIGT